MEINFTGQHTTVTPYLRDLITKKFDRVKRQLNNNIISANVVLTAQKLNNGVETVLHLKGAEITASAEDENMYKAIDKMLIKLNAQIQKYKDKVTDHR